MQPLWMKGGMGEATYAYQKFVVRNSYLRKLEENTICTLRLFYKASEKVTKWLFLKVSQIDHLRRSRKGEIENTSRQSMEDCQNRHLPSQRNPYSNN